MSHPVGIIMGSQSDWDTLRHASETLDALAIAHDVRVVSAHRTPDLLFEYAETAVERGLKVLIAGAGGAAHLPGMAAAKTRLPVLGVPVQTSALQGEVQYRTSQQPSIDGNTVDMDGERMRFADNTVRYEADLSIATSKIKSMMAVIQNS